MDANRNKRWLTLLFPLLCAPGCGGRPAATPAQGDVCGGATRVELTDSLRAGDVFERLRGPTTAGLTFACPSTAPCTLPSDTTIELRAQFHEPVACEFAACRVPYAFAGLPFEGGQNEPCPKVLWSVARVQLKTNAGTVDLSDEQRAPEVNVLARAQGDGFVRFMVESPSSVQSWLAPGEARAVLLDVQLEFTKARVRGQMSALAAPLSAEPAAELRFTSLWTATWESPK